MKKLVERQAEILERTMYMLSENSVTFVAEQDKDFASYVDSLAESVWQKRMSLLGTQRA